MYKDDVSQMKLHEYQKTNKHYQLSWNQHNYLGEGNKNKFISAFLYVCVCVCVASSSLIQTASSSLKCTVLFYLF